MISKDLRQNATPPVSSPGATGSRVCSTDLTPQSPPRRVTPPGPCPSDPIWRTLTPDQRQVLLHALGRLLARRLPATTDAKEVRDERN